ncbi:MAG: hypothetical protein JKY84_00790 [Emcibacteraceae bacterium]|nr:hypothetical protein [Emcibacteraceae bacterium]
MYISITVIIILALIFAYTKKAKKVSYLIELSGQSFNYENQEGLATINKSIKGLIYLGRVQDPRTSIAHLVPSHLEARTLTQDKTEIVEFVGVQGGLIEVVSDKFKKLVENANVPGVEFFPIPMRMVTKDPIETVDGYYLMNVYETLDIIDYESSEFIKAEMNPNNPDEYSNIPKWKRLVLTVNNIDNDLFRLPGMKRKLFISERFYKILQENEIRNIRVSYGFMDKTERFQKISDHKYFGE